MTKDKLGKMKSAIRSGRMVEDAGGIAQRVEQSDKLGFDWKVTEVNGVVVRREYIEQETPVGTADNPIVWKVGMTAYPNFYYTLDGVRKVWTGEDAESPDWEDARFVEY